MISADTYTMIIRGWPPTSIWALIVMLLCTGCSNRHPGDDPDIPDIWQALSPLVVGNAGFIAGFVDDQMLVIGGTNWTDGNKAWLRDAWSFPAGSTQWRTIQPLPAPIAYAAFGSNDRGVYWLGGSDGVGTLDGFYRVTNGSSIDHVSDTGHKVVYAGAAADDEALYIVGGAEDVSDLSTLSDRFLRVSLQTGKVSLLPPYPGGAVMLPAVVYTGREILVFGGARYDAATSQVVNVTDAYAYSLQHTAWRKLAPVPYARRGMAACRLNAGTTLISGGYGSREGRPEEGFIADAMTYRVSDDRYLPATDLPYAAMGQSLINNRGMLYLLGGEDRPRNRTSAFYVYRVFRE
jgi:galactose oxidase-like protein